MSVKLITPLSDIAGIDETFQVIRKKLIRKASVRVQEGARLILINAQAGQGKSVLASQLATALSRKPIFLHLSPGDRDPVTFIANALRFFKGQVEAFEMPSLERKITEGALTKQFVPFAWKELLKTLDRLGGDRRVLVCEDLQTVDHSLTQKVLTHTCFESPGFRMLTIITTRRNPFVADELQKMGPCAVYLDNTDLAFSRPEIFELFNRVHRVDVDRKAVDRILLMTEGWAMGLIILSHSMRASPTTYKAPDAVLPEQLWYYFVNHVFDRFPAHVRKHWLYLSLLEDVPGDLALIVCRPFDIVAKLFQAANENQFVQIMDQERPWFRFHQIYRDVLRELAWERLARPETDMVQRQAADWYRENGFIRRCLTQLTQLKDYRAIDGLLKVHAPELYLQNRIEAIGEAIRALPQRIRDDNTYICYAESLTLIGSQPIDACLRMSRAYDLADKAADPFACLIVLEAMMTWHTFFKKGLDLTREDLKRATRLYEAQKFDLPEQLRVHVAKSLALGYCIIENDFQKSYAYIDKAIKIAMRREMSHLVISLKAARGLCLFLEGRHAAFATALENLLKQTQKKFLSNENLHLLVLLQLLYFGDGEFKADFDIQKRLALGAVPDPQERKILKPLTLFCDLRHATMTGDLERGRRLVTRMTPDAYQALSRPLAAWFGAYQSFLGALDTHTPSSPDPARMISALESLAEGGYFYLSALILYGCACRLTGHQARALKLLDKARRYAIRKGVRHYEYSADAHLALLYQDMGDTPDAVNALRTWLNKSRELGYLCFIGNTPEMLQQLLQAALEQGVSDPNVTEIAYKCLQLHLQPHRSPLPVLRLKTLGRFELSDQRGRQMTADQISAEHRRLLAILAATPNGGIAMGDFCQLLWPRVDPLKSRRRLNTSISRLRGQLERFIDSSRGADYILVSNEIVQLSHIEADFEVLEEIARQGFWLSGQGYAWRACIAFERALDLWSDDWFPEMLDENPIAERSHRLKELYHRIVLEWSQCLIKLGQFDYALDITRRGLKAEPLSHELWRLAYHIGLFKGDRRYARQIIEAYTGVLSDYDFDQDEIDHTLSDLRTISPPGIN